MMDIDMEDQDELCESQPKMYDTPLSCALNKESTVFTSMDVGSSSSDMYPMDLCTRDKSKLYSNPCPVRKCTCRENVEWKWDVESKTDFVDIVNDGMDAKFHTSRSNGTASVRCSEPMSNDQYYWELQIIYKCYGTDVMIGIGTPDAELKYIEDKFASRLGMDNKTWGFSYTGLFHHNGQRRCYAENFNVGNVVGMHLDLWRGTLSFYKDRHNLGIASTGLKGKTLYAMASSTSAKTGLRIIQSSSFPSSLQFLCCAKLRELIPDDQNVLDVINIPPGLKSFLQKHLNWLLSKRYIDNNQPLCCPLIPDPPEPEVVVAAAEHPLENQHVYLGSVKSDYDFNEAIIRHTNADFSSERTANRQRWTSFMDCDQEN